MHCQQNDKYTEMHCQQNDNYTEMHSQQNDKYTEMHCQQNVKRVFYIFVYFIRKRNFVIHPLMLKSCVTYKFRNFIYKISIHNHIILVLTIIYTFNL